MLFLLLILQISVCVVILYALLTYALSANAEFAISSKALSSRGGFYMVESQAFLREDFSGGEFDELISVRDLETKYSEELRNYRVASSMATKTSDGKTTLVEGVSGDMMRLFDLPLLKGKVFTSVPNQDGAINAVTSFGKVGERFETDIYFGASVKRVTFLITGILRQSFPYFRMKGSVTELSWVFNWGKTVSDSIILCNLDALGEQGIKLNLHHTNLFVFKSEVTDIRMKEIVTDLKSYGTYYDLSELKAQSIVEMKGILNTFFPILGFLMLTTLSNFAMAVALFTFISIKDVAILYLCGAKRKDANIIIMLSAGAICIVSIVLLILLLNYIVPSIAFIRAALDTWVALVMIVFVCSLFLTVAFFSSKAALKQRNISLILRRG